MGVNIKNPEAERLNKELAKVTGMSQTEVVTEAVREKLARVSRRGVADRLMEIARETAPLLKGVDLHKEIDGLYDYLHEDYGLPR
jgi:antitoxin VapB